MKAKDLQDIISQTPHAEGSTNVVWRIPDSDTVLRMSRSQAKAIRNLPPDAVLPPLSQISDPSGQLLGKIGDDIKVLKYQPGVSMAPGWRGALSNATPEQIADFKRRFIERANMPQSAYDDLVKQVVDVEAAGMRFDPSRLGNILTDPSTGRFNIVDLDEVPSQRKTTARELVLATRGDSVQRRLLQALPDDPELVAAIERLEDKMEVAFKNSPGMAEPKGWAPLTKTRPSTTSSRSLLTKSFTEGAKKAAPTVASRVGKAVLGPAGVAADYLTPAELGDATLGGEFESAEQYHRRKGGEDPEWLSQQPGYETGRSGKVMAAEKPPWAEEGWYRTDRFGERDLSPEGVREAREAAAKKATEGEV